MSAPLWNSKSSTFAGLLTSSDFINVIQYYWQYPEKFEEIERFRLDSLRGPISPFQVSPNEGGGVAIGLMIRGSLNRH